MLFGCEQERIMMWGVGEFRIQKTSGSVRSMDFAIDGRWSLTQKRFHQGSWGVFDE